MFEPKSRKNHLYLKSFNFQNPTVKIIKQAVLGAIFYPYRRIILNEPTQSSMNQR